MNKSKSKYSGSNVQGVNLTVISEESSNSPTS